MSSEVVPLGFMILVMIIMLDIGIFIGNPGPEILSWISAGFLTASMTSVYIWIVISERKREKEKK